jgi:hypothetical protein
MMDSPIGLNRGPDSQKAWGSQTADQEYCEAIVRNGVAAAVLGTIDCINQRAIEFGDSLPRSITYAVLLR